MLTREKFIELLEKYTLDTISAEERSKLLAAILSDRYDEIIAQHVGGNLKDDSTEGANIPPNRSEEILHKILSSEKQNLLLFAKKSNRSRAIRWAVATTFFGIIIAAGLLLNNTDNKKENSSIAFTKGLEEKINNSTAPLKINLEDGSTVTLQPGSNIHFPKHFLPAKREVYLDGEAFFEVTKNPQRPFFVYNKNIVTHVLGTSFNVKINKETQQVEVSVRTGRVEVYENNAEKNAVAKKSNGVILLPNQKVIYDESAKQFVPSLVDKPLPLVAESTDKKITTESSVFEEAALKTVLPYLEKNYGVEIIVENDNLYKCLFTGDINQQDLYTRLDVVCRAIGASYEVKGTKILIKGKGCN